MIIQDLLLGALIALLCGLDRVAVLQIMISRPLVAAPLTGMLLGQPLIGLQVGIMMELLWLARLPVGAAIPPDDTQVSIAATVLAVTVARMFASSGPEPALFCLLVTLPLGKLGQYFDHRARRFNDHLPELAELAIERGSLRGAERQHLKGLLSFSVAALGTYIVILGGGLLIIPFLWPLIEEGLVYSSSWIQLALPLIGVAVILGTINVSRSITLFCASFGMAFLLMWLV